MSAPFGPARPAREPERAHPHRSRRRRARTAERRAAAATAPPAAQDGPPASAARAAPPCQPLAPAPTPFGPELLGRLAVHPELRVELRGEVLSFEYGS